MPDYEIDALNKEVGVKIYGNTINEKYTELLKENNTLNQHDDDDYNQNGFYQVDNKPVVRFFGNDVFGVKAFQFPELPGSA